MTTRTLLLALLLPGCGLIATHEARDPRGAIIGLGLPDVIHCMGIPAPDHRLRVSDEAAELQYDFTNNDMPTTLALFGTGISFGGPGRCSATVTVLREGIVADIGFPGSHVAGLGLPAQACQPLVAECLAHPGGTELPRGYDSFAVLFPGKG